MHERSGVYFPSQSVASDSSNIPYFVSFQKLLEYFFDDEIAF